MINERDLHSLELKKVLKMLSAFTSCPDAEREALSVIPQTDMETVNRLLTETDDAYRLLARFGGPSFGGLTNVNNELKRAEMGSVLTIKELLSIAKTLTVVKSLSAYRNSFSGVSTSLDSYFQKIVPNKYLEEKIGGIIVSEDEIADNASPLLSDIRRKMKAAGSRVREQLQRLTKSQTFKKYLQESIVTIRDGRYVVPVKAEYRSEVPGMVHDMSSSGSTLFIEPISVVEANNELRVLNAKEEAEIERILAELSAEAGSFSDSIKESYENAVRLNVIFAKANLGYKMKAFRPEVNHGGEIFLKKARHPLLDQQTAVPIDVFLGNTFDTLIITGPNTGGKTVTLKTVGLLTLMAMCGLMIPAGDGSKIAVFEKVLADIGDEQSIEQSLSTFSAHMTNIKRILAKADGQSLVLLDELGAGTDPVEGAALAESILEELHLLGAKISATTHYAELKAYALRTPYVENASCEFNVETLAPTYRLMIGAIGQSNAFAISRRLGINDTVIKRAERLISDTNKDFEDVVKKLEKTRRELEQKTSETEELRLKAASNMREAEEKIRGLDLEHEKALEKAREKAKDILETAQYKADELLNSLEAIKKQITNENAANMLMRARQEVKSGLHSLEDISDPVDIPENKDYKLPRPLQPGDTVLIVDINKTGTVIEPADKEGLALVGAGIFKTRVDVSNLRLIENQKREMPKTRTVRTDGSERSTRSPSAECDLRGLDSLDAITELDHFIDNAIMAGLKQVTIIHGKGTGVLRSAVQNHLRSHRNVRTFRLGLFGEGENGVTVAELK